MDIKSVVARIAADCDLRTRFIRNVPGLFDNFFLSGSGELLTEEEINNRAAFTYFFNGMDFLSGELSKV